MGVENESEYKSEEERQATEQFENGGDKQEESLHDKYNRIYKKREAIQNQMNILQYGEQTKYGFNRNNSRELTSAEQEQLDDLRKQEEIANTEFQKVSNEKYYADLKNPEMVAIRKRHEEERNKERKRTENGEDEISLYGPRVEEAEYKLKAAEMNGDSDDIAEARTNYDKVLKDNLERGREVREHENEFDDQMSGG